MHVFLCVADNFQALIQYSDSISAQTGKAVSVYHFCFYCMPHMCCNRHTIVMHITAIVAQLTALKQCRYAGSWTLAIRTSVVYEQYLFTSDKGRVMRSVAFIWLLERLGDHPPKVDPGAFSGQRQGSKTPQEDLLAVHCFCVCSRSALLGDLLGVSTSMERDLLSVLLIYHSSFSVYWFMSLSKVSWCVIVFCYMFICVSCFGLVVSTCQVIGYRKTPLMTPSWGEEIISTKPGWKSVFVYIFLFFGLFMLLCVPPALHNIYFICLWHNVACMCWKCH